MDFPAAQRGPAMALWGIGVMIGPVIGPTLGGYLTDEYSWHWVFFINVPIGILAAFGVARFLPDTPNDRRARFDWFGFTALTVALCSLQIMLERFPY
jgi:DHA2 family multidrug resistance protein